MYKKLLVGANNQMLMSISVVSIGFVLPQNRQLTLKVDFIPYTPTRKLKVFMKDVIKNRTKIYKKGSGKI